MEFRIISKYSPKDTIWFMHENRVFHGEIWEIIYKGAYPRELNCRDIEPDNACFTYEVETWSEGTRAMMKVDEKDAFISKEALIEYLNKTVNNSKHF